MTGSRGQTPASRTLLTVCRVCACSETHTVPSGVPLAGRPLALIMGDERLGRMDGVCGGCTCHEHGAPLPSWRWEAGPSTLPATAPRSRASRRKPA